MVSRIWWSVSHLMMELWFPKFSALGSHDSAFAPEKKRTLTYRRRTQEIVIHFPVRRLVSE